MAKKALGIINYEPSYVQVEGIESHRPISAASIFSRYRIIDFMMSNFSNSGIDNIKVQIKSRPRSLVEHFGNTNYNINSKRGSIHLLTGEKTYSNELYNNDVASFAVNMQYIVESNAPYVVIAPSHFIFIQDFEQMLEAHKKSKNDITCLYQKVSDADESFLMCDIFDINKQGKITAVYRNRGKHKHENISLETYIMSMSTFVDLVNKAQSISSLYTLRDVLYQVVHDKEYKVGTFAHKGFCECISTLKAYYHASQEILKDGVLDEVINDEWPIYTMTNDSCPTLYKPKANVSGSIVGNGCEINGTVINSIIGRGVVIKEGAIVKDSIIMPKCVINNGVELENVVIDKYAVVTHSKSIKGTKDAPMYVNRRDRI